MPRGVFGLRVPDEFQRGVASAAGQTIAVGQAIETETAGRIYRRQSGVRHKVGSFTPPTTTAVNTSVTGVGFQPKLVIFYGNKSHAPDGNGYDDSWAFFIGAEGPQGVGNRGAVAFRADEFDHNSGSASTDTRALWTPNDGTPAVSQAAQVVSFDDNGFTVSWNSANASNGDIRYIAIGGTGVTIDVGRIGSGTGASVSTTSPGFQPDGLILFSTSQTNTGSLVTSSNIRFSIGVTDGTNQVALAVADTDVEPTAVTSYQRTDRVLLLPGAPDTVDAEATLTSFDPTGFTLGFSDPAAADVAIFYIAIKDAYFHVGSFDQPTSTGSQEIELPFLAGTFITFGTGQLASSSLQTPSDAHLNLGAGTPNDSVSVWGHEADGTSRNADRSFKVNSLIRQADSSRNTVAEAAITSFDANSVNLNWTTVDATARQSLFVAIGPGSTYVTVGQITETETAGTITPAKSLAVGQALETETAGTITPAKRVAVGQALETETAQTITPTQASGQSVAVGQAIETETAGAITPTKRLAVGQAIETETAGVVTPAKKLAVGQATETETARTITPAKSRVVGQATEAETAQSITPRKMLILFQAIELETASTITPTGGTPPEVPPTLHYPLSVEGVVKLTTITGSTKLNEISQTVYSAVVAGPVKSTETSGVTRDTALIGATRDTELTNGIRSSVVVDRVYETSVTGSDRTTTTESI